MAAESEVTGDPRIEPTPRLSSEWSLFSRAEDQALGAKPQVLIKEDTQ
jgi:hypothetical protein